MNIGQLFQEGACLFQDRKKAVRYRLAFEAYSMICPATHFREYGQWFYHYAEVEHTRDHLFCAIYGTFANVKRLESEKYDFRLKDWKWITPDESSRPDNPGMRRLRSPAANTR